MADPAPTLAAEPTKALDKRTALAVLDMVEMLLRAESMTYDLVGREVYADGLEDAAIRVAELRRMLASMGVSSDYHPRSLLARAGRSEPACGRSKPCRKPLGHEGDCGP